MDLRIDRGIRKPSYSTNLSYLSPSSTQGYTSSSGDANNEPPLDDFQHSAPILQIESLSPYDSSHLSVTSSSSSNTMGIISQFVSIDESGLVIFWITSQTQRTNQDLQCSPWAGVALIQTRQLRHCFHNPNRPISPSSVVNKGQDVRHNNNHTTSVSTSTSSSGTSLQGKSLLAIIPEDISTILITKSTGAISKLPRFGLPEAPHILHRCHNYSIDISAAVDDSNSKASSVSDNNSNNKNKVVVPSIREVNYFSAISCISVRSPIHIATDPSVILSKLSITSSNSSNSSDMIIESKDNIEGTISSKVVTSNVLHHQSAAALILVGRSDGTVDLFQVDTEHPIQSWDLTTFTAITSTTSNVTEKQTSTTSSVVLLQWCSNRASVFFAVDSNGNIFYFDLNQNPYSPITVDSIKIGNKQSILLHTGLIDISKCVSNTGLFNIIVSVPNLKSEGDSIRTRRGNKYIAKQLSVVNNNSSTTNSQQQLLNEEISLRTSLHRLSTEKFAMQSVTFVSNNHNNNLNTSYK